MREYLTKGMPTQAILSVLAGFVHMIARNDLITVETVVGSQITAPSDFQFAKTTNKLLEAATGCRVVSVKEGTRYRAKDIVADVAIHSGWDSEFGLIQEELTLDTDTVEATESKTEESEAKSQENPAPGPESEAAMTVVKPRPMLTLDIDQFWYPRHMVKELGRFVVTKGGTYNVVSYESGYYDRFKFHELPPYGKSSTLDMPLYLGYFMGPHTVPYFANHFEGLGDTANAEFRDKWDISGRPFLRNEFIQTAEIKNGSQFLVDYGSMRAKKDKKLLPDSEPVESEDDEGDGDEGEGDHVGKVLVEVQPVPAQKKRKTPGPGQLMFSFDVSLHCLLQKLTSSRARKLQRKTSRPVLVRIRMRPTTTTAPTTTFPSF
jgi:hypothetical protein